MHYHWPSYILQNIFHSCVEVKGSLDLFVKQESIPVGCVPPLAPTVHCSGGGCPQMSKFEQVCSDDHQTSLAQGPRFAIRGGGGEGGNWVRSQGGCCNIAQF